MTIFDTIKTVRITEKALGAAGGYAELTKYNAAPGGGALTVFSL